MLLEIIATSLKDAERAEAGGADRIELVANLELGGLTPDFQLLKSITASVKIPVHVMIRPHARSFHMSSRDIAEMSQSIQQAESNGAAALVFGMLTPNQKIDRVALDQLLAVSTIPITFHRAFDEVDDQVEALEELLEYPRIHDVLTSGGAASALQAIDQIRHLQSLTAGHHINILAGAGLTLEQLSSFVQATNVRSVHLGTAVRENNRIDGCVDVEKVKQARALLDSLIK